MTFLARTLEWVANFSSGGSSIHRDQTHVSCISCIADKFTAEPLGKLHQCKIIFKTMIDIVDTSYILAGFILSQYIIRAKQCEYNEVKAAYYKVVSAQVEKFIQHLSFVLSSKTKEIMWNENGTQNMFQISTMAEDDIKDDCGLLTRIKYLTDILLIFIFVLYLFSYIATYSFKY